MKEFKFVPEAFGEEFSGHIMVRTPKTRERMQYIKLCNFKITEAGELDTKNDNDYFDMMSKLIELSEGHVLAVEVKHKDGTEFKTFEDLESDNRCDKIMAELSMAVVKGFSVSKN